MPTKHPFGNEEPQDEVEAHGKKAPLANEEPADEILGKAPLANDDDDVEAHGSKHPL